jgi:hypothetical protein
MEQIVEEKPTILESIIDSAENYGKTSIELIKLKALKKVSEAASSMAANLVVIVVSVLFIVILSIGVSLWIGDELGKSYLGFFVVAGFYLLMAIIFLIGRNQLVKTPVSNSIIKSIID